MATAYRKLESEGLVRTGVGSGTYVIAPDEGQSTKLDRSIRKPLFSSGAESLLRLQADLPDFSVFPEQKYNFAALVPDEKLFPVERFRECLNHTLDNEKAMALQYCGSLGSLRLRERIAGRMARKGAHISADRILIVSGAQQGCDLVFRTFLSPGDRIIVGSPTYHNIYPLMRQMEVGVAPVPVLNSGLDTIALERAADDPAARLIYTMPNFQNPTGLTATKENRMRVLEIAAAANLPLLEDDYEGDLAIDDELPSIHSLDREERVLYVGTFSKSLFPGLRVGWIAAPKKFIAVLSALKKASDLENSALLQGALEEFCARGYYDEHLVTVRAAIRERMECVIAALERFMPPGSAWSRPRGGYAIWVTLPEGVRSERIYRRAGERGVLVSPGTLFTGGGKDPGAVRLSISRTDCAAIEEGVRVLADVVRSEAAVPGPAAPARSETPQHL